MKARRLCSHGSNNPVAPDCPGDGFYWTPQQIADGWWKSPSHFGSLYAAAKANAVARGAYAAGAGGKGYQTVACVTFRL